MATNELLYLLELIAKAGVWVLARTVDVICTLLYICSIVSPWRAIEEITSVRRFGAGYDEYWEYCTQSFFLTIFDCFAVPMGLFSLLQPLRWASFSVIKMKYHSERAQSDFPWETRFKLFSSGFYAIIDFLCLPFGLLTMCFMVRAWVVWHELSFQLPQIVRPVDPVWRDIKRHEMQLNKAFFVEFWMSLVDLCVFLVMMPFLCCSWYLWKSWRNGISELRSIGQSNCNSIDFNVRMEAYGDWYWDLRLFCGWKVVQVLMDICCLPFILFALLSPIRSTLFRKECRKNGFSWCVCGEVAEAPTNELCGEVGKPTGINDLEYFYNIQIRKAAFYYGFLAVSDLLLLPFLLPLLLTWYRFRPVKEQLTSSEPWGCQQISIVLFQTMLLLCDLLILPFSCILFLTRVRWGAVKASYEVDDMCSEKSFDTYGTILNRFFFLLLDLLTCPFAFVVLATHYRSAVLWKMFETPQLFNSVAAQVLMYHFSVMLQFFICIHDVVLLLPALLFSFVFGFRCRYLMRLLKGQPAILASPEENAEQQCERMLKEGMHWRCLIWELFLNIFVDIFAIFLPGLVVIGTLWRATALLNALSGLGNVYNHEVPVSSDYISSKERKAARSYYNNARKHAFTQLLKLFVDIFCLVPLVLIVITLYRLPGVIIQLFAKFREQTPLSLRTPVMSARATDNDDGSVDPLIKCSSVLTEFPERGGPRVVVRGTRLSNQTTEGDQLNTASPLSFHPSVAKMQIVGTSLWKLIDNVFGSTAAAVGKSVLPMSFVDKVGISLGEITSQLQLSVERTLGEIEFWVQFDFGNVKRTTLMKNIRKLINADDMVRLCYSL